MLGLGFFYILKRLCGSGGVLKMFGRAVTWSQACLLCLLNTYMSRVGGRLWLICHSQAWVLSPCNPFLGFGQVLPPAQTRVELHSPSCSPLLKARGLQECQGWRGLQTFSNLSLQRKKETWHLFPRDLWNVLRFCLPQRSCSMCRFGLFFQLHLALKGTMSHVSVVQFIKIVHYCKYSVILAWYYLNVEHIGWDKCWERLICCGKNYK